MSIDLFKDKKIFWVGALVVVSLFIWVTAVVPALLALDESFGYSAEITSIDNFYDETVGGYLGEQYSKTTFSYSVEGETRDGLIVKNIFDVRTQDDEPIFSVERLYGIDPYTHEHVAGIGDKDRDGYLFAPRNLKEGESFTYWHINYDGPAEMEFVAEELLFGLKVFHYQSAYNGVTIDQTDNLSYLPGVPEERGVVLEPTLDVWIEPVSGRLVKYQDDTIAYYYDIETGEKLNPWNNFQNIVTDQSVRDQVRLAQTEKVHFQFLYTYVPTLVILFVLLWAFFINESGRKRIDRLLSGWFMQLCAATPFAVGALVFVSWVGGFQESIQIFFAGGGMNPFTALCFALFGLALVLLVNKKTKLAALLSGAVFVISCARIASIFWEAIPAIDLYFFSDAVLSATVPSRMSLFTAISLVVATLALYVFTRAGKYRKFFVVLPLGLLLVNVIALVAYGFPDLGLLSLSIFFSVSFKTAALFVLVSMVLLYLFGFHIKNENVIVVVVLFFALTGTFTVSAYMQSLINHQLETQFAVETEKVKSAILNRVDVYASTLAGGVGLFNASDEVERGEFRDYVSALEIQRYYPGIQGVGFATVVESEDDVIEAVRADGFPEFSIFPESNEDLRTSIIYLEPFDERNQRAFGYDMFTEENRRMAMSAARDAGTQRISEKITLLQETEEDVQAGFLMYLPVYTNGVDTSTVSLRREHLEGFVYSPFRMNDFMAGLLPRSAERLIDFHVYDGLSTNEDNELYDDDSGEYSKDDEYTPGFVRSEIVYVAGRPWTIEFISLPAFGLNVSDRFLPLGILVAGSLISVLAALALYVLLVSRERLVATRGLQLQTLIENFPYGVLIEDENRKIVLVNKKVIDIFGGTNAPQELVGMDTRDGAKVLEGVYKNYATYVGRIEEIINQQEVVVDEKIELTGGRVFARNYAPLFRDNKYSGAVWTYKDITKQNEIDEMKTDFVSMVSHQLKTPVAQIKGYISNMLDGLTGHVNKKQQEYLEDMMHVADQNSQLIDDLLNVSRIERGVIKIETKDISVNALINDVISPLERVAKIKGVDLVVSPLTKDVSIEADEGKVLESVRNIVDNAIKFTPKGKKVTLAAKEAKDGVVLQISDQGPGIDKDVQTELFEKERVWSGKVKASGAGLGLYLSKKFITLQGGTIEFKTGPEGTVFTITLKK